MVAKKVYCKHCKFYEEKKDSCEAPKNKRFEDTYKERIVIYLQSPYQRNSNNSCTLYKWAVVFTW
jgi:hypothetical protein